MPARPRSAQALVVRVGFGSGERVAEGRWDRARELAARRRPAARARTAALRPQERLAALLAGRDAALACEELTLRVRLDVDAARWREAALGLQVALAAALAELEPWREAAGLAARLEELRARSDEVRGRGAGGAAGRRGRRADRRDGVGAAAARSRAAARGSPAPATDDDAARACRTCAARDANRAIATLMDIRLRAMPRRRPRLTYANVDVDDRRVHRTRRHLLRRRAQQRRHRPAQARRRDLRQGEGPLAGRGDLSVARARQPARRRAERAVRRGPRARPARRRARPRAEPRSRGMAGAGDDRRLGQLAGGYEAAGFRKDRQGQVHLRGLISQSAGVPSKSKIIAVLPAGYRPASRQILTTFGGAPPGVSRVDMLPDGALTWLIGPTPRRTTRR